jgi:hypothetical protein
MRRNQIAIHPSADANLPTRRQLPIYRYARHRHTRAVTNAFQSLAPFRRGGGPHALPPAKNLRQESEPNLKRAASVNSK